MNWQEIQVIAHREAQEAISYLLMAAGSQGVSVADTADYITLEDRFGEIYPEVSQSDMVTITGYYPESEEADQLVSTLSDQIAALEGFGIELGEMRLTSKRLSEEDWSENWKRYYEPARITHDLTIVPSWTDYKATSQEKVIRLDPGMAFGTGTHPTTKMSLFALEQVLRGQETVIDVGTGSGVLAIASCLLGAKEVLALDVDEVATRVAKDNIALNKQATAITVSEGDLLSEATTKAHVIVANILADILVRLPKDAYRLLEEDGYLIVSGIIADKWDMVERAFSKEGLYLETHMIQDKWHAAVFKKTDDPMSVIGG